MRCKFLFLLFLSSLNTFCQTGLELIARHLVAEGFENVCCVKDTSGYIISIEATPWKIQRVGADKAKQIIIDDGITDYADCHLIMTDNGVPRLTLAALKGTTSLEQWTASYGVDSLWEKLSDVKKINKSNFRPDIRVYAQLYMKNYTWDKLYDSRFELGPAFELPLWKGAKFTFQVIFPLWANGYNGYERKIRPGYITLEQRLHLPYNIEMSAVIGNFDQMCYGGDVDVMMPLRNQHWTINGRVGYVGIGYFYGFSHFFYNGQKECYWSLGPDYYWRKYNTQFSLRLEHYVLGETGIKAEMVSHFKYLSVGFYAQKSKNISLNGGLKFVVALPSYHHSHHGYWPRVDFAQSTSININAGSQGAINGYMMPFHTVDDSYIKHNQFNPHFIH